MGRRTRVARLIDRQPINAAEKPRPGRVRRFLSIQVGPWRSNQRQGVFAFRERTGRLESTFKRLIVLATVVTVALLLFALPMGRVLTRWLVTRGRWLAMSSIGAVPDRSEIDAEWRRKRLLDIQSSRGTLEQTFAEYTPAAQRLLRFAGLDPDHALVRWGHHDRTVLLPATVFESDDAGRSYRFRANLRSICVCNFPARGPLQANFQVPDWPELTDVVTGTGAMVVERSVQTTNSWGLRGPEPDLTATWRGIVLGDSYMQGLFVGDHETPTECLKRDLSARLHASVEILNTGHLGYSPEQYYYTLLEYAQRFRPRFVLISLFASNFGGDIQDVLEGKGDWEEGCYWLAEIRQFCLSRRITYLFVPVPWAAQLDDARSTGFYPGLVTNYLRATSQEYFDPIADFVNAKLKLSIETKNQAPGSSPLLNGRIGDGHFSARGAELWASAVGHRLALFLELAGASDEAQKRQHEASALLDAKAARER
jgi:hypothetical protein